MIRPLALTFCLLVAGTALAQDARKIAEAERELATVQARIESVGSEIRDDRRKQDRLQHDLQAVEQAIAEATARLKSLDRQLTEQARSVESARQEQQQVAASVRQQQTALARQLRAAHVMGDRPQTRLLLNQDDARQLSRVMTFFGYLNAARAERIAALRDEIEQLRTVEARLDAAREALAASRVEQASTVARLDQQRGERREAVRALEARIRDRGQALKQLQRDEAAVQKLLASLTDILADIPINIGKNTPFAQSRGKLVPPVRGKVLAAYGQAKGGTGLRWKGQWLSATSGSTVRAAASGRVAYVGWMHRYGLMVILEHDGGYYTLYGHADAADVRLGQWVQAGDRIARAGTSGGHRDSGVYFEVRKGKNAIDPRPWLSR